jgi:hypothetical protein
MMVASGRMPVTMRNLLLLFLLLIVPAVFAQSAKVGGPKTADTCTLVSKAEIQAATGVKVGDGVLNKRADAAVGLPCEFKVEP